MHTNFYQILTTFDYVSKAPKVPSLVRISPLSGDLQSFGDVVKRGQNSIKIGIHLNFCPRSPVEFEAFIQKKLDWPSGASPRGETNKSEPPTGCVQLLNLLHALHGSDPKPGAGPAIHSYSLKGYCELFSIVVGLSHVVQHHHTLFMTVTRHYFR